MKPTFSIIFFTVISGAGLGLLAWLALADMCPEPLLAASALFRGVVSALTLVAVGLASSVLHLAKPSNAWRALSRVRTSWLSREAALALLVFVAGFAYLLAIRSDVAGTLRSVLAFAVLLLALAVLFCTAMIYASLKPIRQWHTYWTPANYLLLGCWSGALGLIALSLAYPASDPTAATETTAAQAFAVIAALAGATALVAKFCYWRYIAADSGAATIERAIGVYAGVHGRLATPTTVARARLFDTGHSQRTFLTDEFGFQLARRHALLLRVAVYALVFAVPLAWLSVGSRRWDVALVVWVVCLVGVFVERWLFFAEARHTVRLYHGEPRT